ncbi:hypothetical protein LZ554_002574 [Drepanopeziza brunnea f. sp. 'monogermtubi']|nr:hypothetical protein LZ554_002574 [Drepanopeziza brunnea f. sp. 'monogermtubi']
MIADVAAHCPQPAEICGAELALKWKQRVAVLPEPDTASVHQCWNRTFLSESREGPEREWRAFEAKSSAFLKLDLHHEDNKQDTAQMMPSSQETSGFQIHNHHTAGSKRKVKITSTSSNGLPPTPPGIDYDYDGNWEDLTSPSDNLELGLEIKRGKVTTDNSKLSSNPQRKAARLVRSSPFSAYEFGYDCTVIECYQVSPAASFEGRGPSESSAGYIRRPDGITSPSLPVSLVDIAQDTVGCAYPRSPPMDRDDAESSEASRWNCRGF